MKKNKSVKEKKNTWEPFKICLLNSTANPTQFGWKLAGLTVLFSRQILRSLPLTVKGRLFSKSQMVTVIFFSRIYYKFFRYETIETQARTFFMVIIFSIAGVK